MRSRNIHSHGLRWCGFVLSLAVLVVAGPACAAPPPDTIPPSAMPQSASGYRGDGFEQGADNSNATPLPWRQLSPEQRGFLMPIRSQWNQLP
ncbi:MAG TPA: hypothetical protein VGT79_05645, partial [Xanthomonadaceae bacterium]|nr:hypothetical protein [Xanthomonadaceae bacterium]